MRISRYINRKHAGTHAADPKLLREIPSDDFYDDTTSEEVLQLLAIPPTKLPEYKEPRA